MNTACPPFMRKSPTALSQDPHAVIFKIPEAIRSAREHFHLRVEAFGDPIGLGEAPHAHDGLGRTQAYSASLGRPIEIA